MGRINVLEKQVAELIAAGEVVERPASIAKELVENAIDAGASKVTVEIRHGGIQYLRVSDNGCGIDRDDVPKAFLRHATSKVRDSGDLNHITTMGFRGEALASIAAVCRVELLTRTEGEVAGTRFSINGDDSGVLEDAGCPVGTTITVRDVFFNTPARMKFLKKDVTEGNSVAAVVEKAALAEPGIAFQLIRDGSIRLQTPGDGKILSAARAVYGREFTDQVLPVRYTHEGLSLEGLISKPQISRGSRSMQNFYINRRFVRSKTCMVALEEAFKGALMIGKYPSCVLNLTIPPQTVDVNVHPAKTEVRFANERMIFDLVFYGCKTALGSANLAPELITPGRRGDPFAADLPQDPPKQQRMSALEYRKTVGSAGKTAPPPSIPVKPVVNHPARVSLDIATESDPEGQPLVRPQKVSLRPLTLDKNAPSSPASKVLENPEKPEISQPQVCKENDLYSAVRIIGEAFSTFILLEGTDELIFIDKHAAHERLLYNRLMRGGTGADRQLMLSPVTVRLSAEEYSVVLENLALFEQAGIGVEDFGDGCVLVREVAPILSEMDLGSIVAEFAQKLLHGNSRLVSQRMEELYHTIACRSAVKAGDRTELPSLEELLFLLREDGDAKHCPHGRPVAVRISKHQLEKKFGRLG